MVAEHAWLTLVRTFLMVFISLESEDDLPHLTDGHIFGTITNQWLYVSSHFFFCATLSCTV